MSQGCPNHLGPGEEVHFSMIQMTTTQIGISQRHVACVRDLCLRAWWDVLPKRTQIVIADAANVRAYTPPPLECYSSE